MKRNCRDRERNVGSFLTFNNPSHGRDRCSRLANARANI